MLKHLFCTLFIFSVLNVFGQFDQNSNSTDSAALIDSELKSVETSLGLDVGYLSFRGFMPIVVDVDFDSHWSAQLGVGPTFNDGLFALVIGNAFPGGDSEIDYRLGLGGYARTKLYLHKREDRSGWSPYVAAGYQYTVWGKDWLDANANVDVVEREDRYTLSAFQGLIGLRRRYDSNWFVDGVIGVSWASTTQEDTYYPSNNYEIVKDTRTLLTVNFVVGVYLDD